MHRFSVVAVCMFVYLATSLAQAETPPASSPEATVAATEQACAACLENLDHVRFIVRRQAEQQLRAMAADPATADLVAAAISRHWQTPDLSFEARKVLKPLLPPVDHPFATSSESIAAANAPGPLLARLTSGNFAEREAAEQQLQKLLREPSQVAPLRAQLKLLLADEQLATADRSVLLRAWQTVRAAWLLDGVPASDENQPSEAQLQTWLDRLAAASPVAGDVAAWTARGTAARELLDALAHDNLATTLRPLVEEKLANERLSSDARRQLESLLEWTRPALVAEYWEGGRNLGLQYLYVDVPTTPEHGLRPTHFDRADDATAHCISGNSLAPGDYPVGVLFPHPRQSGAQFRLVNLSTPYRRMRHEHEVRLADSVRWPEVSQRTLDSYIQQARPLSPDELQLLFDVDPAALSRFAGPYFRRVEDGHFLKDVAGPAPSHPRFGDLGRISRHNVICLILAQRGTRDAVPGLVEAIEQNRIETPTRQARYHLGWIAALSLARRDATPESDDFLAGLIEKTDPLVIDRVGGSQLGATAAAILLRRHAALPEAFGLTNANAELTDDFEWAGYRCNGTSSEQLARVRAWWEGQSRASPQE